MSISQNNINFLNAIPVKTKNTILESIGTHYGISMEEALDEVTYEDAENLLDYMVEPHRSATYVLMQRHIMI